MRRRARRLSPQTQTVLLAMLRDPAHEYYGYELSQQSGLASGTIYPILDRLERDRRWLESRYEDVDPSEVGRRARRLYRLSEQGAASAPAELERARQASIDVSRPEPA